jgi:hypothetical protein
MYYTSYSSCQKQSNVQCSLIIQKGNGVNGEGDAVVFGCGQCSTKQGAFITTSPTFEHAIKSEGEICIDHVLAVCRPSPSLLAKIKELTK